MTAAVASSVLTTLAELLFSICSGPPPQVHVRMLWVLGAGSEGWCLWILSVPGLPW